jgi:hypothetical protein
MIKLQQRAAELSPARRRLLELRLKRQLPADADGSSGQSLVAYVVSADGRSIDGRKLREFLRDRLPQHMIPSALWQVESAPRTPNGKVDRIAMARQGGVRTEAGHDFTPPRTDLERIIAGVWKEVLGLDRVGLHDSFFELGGHSLLMIQLQVKLRAASNLDISVVDLFRYPTVSTQARALEPQWTQSGVADQTAAQDRVRGRAALTRRRQSQLRRAASQ